MPVLSSTTNPLALPPRYTAIGMVSDKRPPPGLLCEPATRRLGSAEPTGCRAQLYFRWKHLGRLVQHSRLSTDKGLDSFSFSKKRSDEECSQTGLLLR